MRQEQIPYGVKDFKRVRLEDRYYVDKSAFSANHQAALDQLKKYSGDPNIPALAGGNRRTIPT